MEWNRKEQKIMERNRTDWKITEWNRKKMEWNRTDRKIINIFALNKEIDQNHLCHSFKKIVLVYIFGMCISFA